MVENRQALETTNLYSEILDSTIDHFGLIMDYDLNHTMQLVATITLVLCVPTIVGGFFGMNLLGIPLAELPYGFAIVTGLTVVVLAALLLALADYGAQRLFMPWQLPVGVLTVSLGGIYLIALLIQESRKK